jgi:hypothetical protein
MAASRSFHTHELGRLHVGCPECIRETRAAEQVARWEQAPLRKVTWKCSYVTDNENAGAPEMLSFTLTVRVPDDATPDEVDEHWAGLTGEAFVLALPDTVPMDATGFVLEMMEVESVTIGPIVDPERVAPIDQPSLFTNEVAS